MNLKNLWFTAILAIILLTSAWFVAVPENKNNNLANYKANFTLNSKPKTSLNFPEGIAPKVFIEPISPEHESQETEINSLPIQSQNGELKNNPTKNPIYFPQIFENSPKLAVNQPTNIKLLNPRSMAGVEELLKLLKGFGNLINVPKDQLTMEFAKRDKEIIQKTKEVYGNPSNFVLGQQCGGEGATDTFPPGVTTNTICGGDPEYSYPNAYYSGGGGSCNTDPPCFGTGFCRYVVYCYRGGCYGYCWIPSCLGVCGKKSYIWDSSGAGDPGVPNAGNCGCGALGSEPVVDISANNAPPVPPEFLNDPSE